MILLTVFITLIVVLLFLNLTSSERKINTPIERLYDIESEDFLRTVSHLLGPPLLTGNHITALHNGDQIFPAMLEAIRGAQHSICFETYIYWAGEIGQEFADSLIERAKAGVSVHVSLDAVGAGKLDRRALRRMRRSGIQIRRYHPLRWYTLGRLNNRTHRKLLIIDGMIGFTGGVGIGDEWRGNARNSSEWRDSHFKLVGPAVLQMQAAFMDNWLKMKNAVLHGPNYFPEIPPQGDMLAQVFTSSPSGGAESVRLMYLLSIVSAKESILLANSYFVPDDLVIKALADAARRGVKVEIILPGKRTDMNIVRAASRALWGKLLRAGIKIYEYQVSMYHAKIMIVDSLWVSVGSTNFDNRSFRLNDEANLNVYDRNFANELTKTFEEDRKLACEIVLAEWKKRPLKRKISEWLASLLRTQL